ncbi:MAG: hypothetical protein J4O09_13910, partial [Chloroflexi bacterium]|nr:hypothetical protein [Chloroflexota bacterium]
MQDDARRPAYTSWTTMAISWQQALRSVLKSPFEHHLAHFLSWGVRILSEGHLFARPAVFPNI